MISALRRTSPSSRVAQLLAAYAFIGGLVTLVGWFMHAPRLTDWIGNGISMFANTALGAVLCATALLILAFKPPGEAHIARWPALVAAALGGLTLIEHLTGWNLRIDNFLVQTEWGARAAVSPGRMGPPACYSYLALGTGFFLATFDAQSRRIACILGISIALLSTLSLIGYVFHANPLFGIARYTGIALQTATMLVALAIGLLAVLPELEPVRTLMENSGAGMLTRRALPFVLTLPVAFGILRTWGEGAGLYDTMMGRALLVVSLTCVFCGLLWWCARVIGRHESALERRATEQAALYQFTDSLQRATSIEQIFESALDCVVSALGCDRASILLFDQWGVMRFTAWRGLSDAYRNTVEGHSPWGADEADLHPISVARVAEADLDDDMKHVILSEGIQACAFIPLVSNSRLIGKVMAYYPEAHEFSDNEIDVAMTIARQLVFGIDHKRADQALMDRSVQIEALNDRLQLAMKETHHRVKNNLQVVSAMIDINVLNHDSEVPVDELGKIGQHVRSLAVIHDLLTQQSRVRDTDFVHTQDIMDRLAPLLQVVAGPRRVKFTVENFPIALRQGTAISVLINELLSNAVKHGKGDIEVCLSVGADTAKVQVLDCGPGFPAGFNAADGANTGFQLIETVCRFDLQGAPSFRNRPEGGAIVTVEFPMQSPVATQTMSEAAVHEEVVPVETESKYEAAA